MIDLHGLLPPQVALMTESGRVDADTLYPQEIRHVAGAVDKRRREFATGRACARRGMAALGLPAAEIGVGLHREPIWPPGLVGSITHCEGLCAAALAIDSEIGGIGIDAEVNRELPDGVADLVILPEEIMEGPPGAPATDLLLFTARESVFKLWFSLTRLQLDHHDVTVALARHDQTFTVRLRRGEHGPHDVMNRVRGAYRWSDSHVLSAAWLPAARQ